MVRAAFRRRKVKFQVVLLLLNLGLDNKQNKKPRVGELEILVEVVQPVQEVSQLSGGFFSTYQSYQIISNFNPIQDLSLQPSVRVSACLRISPHSQLRLSSGGRGASTCQGGRARHRSHKAHRIQQSSSPYPGHVRDERT